MRQALRWLNAGNLAFLFALVLFLHLLHYFFTGLGGPVKLATRLVPIALIVNVLNAYRRGALYPRLPAVWNRLLATLYVVASLGAVLYFELEYENVFLYRAGDYSALDLAVGAAVFVLMMEVSRREHPILFGVNVVLVAYSLWGSWIPIDFLWHPGTSLRRIVTASTVELATGVYGKYAQLALTLVAPFLLMAAVARAYEAQGALLRTIGSLVGRSRHSIPQSAVVSSLAIGMVSGSGSANSAVTGTFTIPLMKQHGIPGVFAAAVETAASMGGLIMPPLMGAAAFIMAEFLGVTYWDVALRGFAVGFVYYAAVALAVYLISVRTVPPAAVTPPAAPLEDKVKTLLFFTAVALLTALLGGFGYGAMRAALYAAVFLFVALVVTVWWAESAEHPPRARARKVLAGLRVLVETHAELTTYIVVLLATLGIMIGLFTVTGFILRMAQILMGLAAVSVAATILMAWVFGWLAGLGLPPTATYVIVAVVIGPPLIKMGLDPWIVHFYAFMLAVWGELSPPTSLTAAVASSIAEASFLRTMWEALKIALPILILPFAFFTRSQMVTQVGPLQLVDTVLVGLAALSLAFALFGRFFRHSVPDGIGRVLLAAMALATLFHPQRSYAAALSLAAAVLLGAGMVRHRRLMIQEGWASAAASPAAGEPAAGPSGKRAARPSGEPAARP